jgi:cation:H+ antiporter
MNLLLFFLGLVFLIVGAELLVRGASKLAGAAGISPLIIGLTVVAFGTSSPELAVSIKSSWSGQSAVALGNIVGSNIFNVLFILGISALIIPLRVSKQLIRFDVPLMIGLSVAVLLLGLNGSLGRLDGIILLIALFSYLFFLYRQKREEPGEVVNETSPGDRRNWLNVVLIVIGLLLLVAGSRFLVDAAVEIARNFGLNELVIGLTLVAAGTSLPEVVTSLVAAWKGERDIAVGNVIGSNIFNLSCVLGITVLVAPEGIATGPEVLGIDLPVMIAVSLFCLPLFFTGAIIDRVEGLMLFGFYIAYTTYLILQASAHHTLDEFTGFLFKFVIPLTFIMLIIMWFRSRHRGGSSHGTAK